ncbi:hypothetical protein A3H26_02855 [candidate division WWE3 bacterium RIFCSPLOWO2_12_FULL_36_10]|uniref:Uncharacterized protein n=1 Tax=candidate division WWE3 bacterium RIFCSPLOWO2_12_FULL_36_10 TaxID=1802630 RepID=A0A1F4VKE9_UNCKA|nr:MAG: hypothetical protein A3H26_02855 [candidate division WWE3 bacterium RIFCSPLOWO2_12_FULL_36_10]
MANIKSIARKINNMAKDDQDIRKKILINKPFSKHVIKKLKEIDTRTTNFMKEVVSNIGLPTISKVGEKASNNAWLLVQHSPDMKFQKKYLNLLKKNVSDVKRANIAYLDDRLRVSDGKPQFYGTQLQKNKATGNWEFCEIKDRVNVNERRKEMGLGTIEDYIEDFLSQD